MKLTSAVMIGRLLQPLEIGFQIMKEGTSRYTSLPHWDLPSMS